MNDVLVILELQHRLDRDPARFRAFYEAALPRVYGYLAHRCGSSTVAEDLAQETFLAAVVELRKGTVVEAPLPWIFGIARHKLIDHYRRSERLELAGRPNEEPGPELDSDGRALAALASLPPAQRLALVLRHVDGLSVPEIADALGRSVEAVESLLARGRVGFRRAYLEAT
jgi:RNA polymerase sigma-70 factor (ECF subfamily)